MWAVKMTKEGLTVPGLLSAPPPSSLSSPKFEGPGQPDVKRSSKVDRVLANQTLGSTASLLTSNIPFAWFLVLGCNRQAQNLFYFCLASYSRSNTRGQRDDRELRGESRSGWEGFVS